MAKITLSDVRAAVSAKYEPLEIELEDGTVAVLPPVMTMPATQRQKFMDAQDAWAGDDDEEMTVAETESRFDEMFAIIIGNAKVAEKLLKNLNLAEKMEIFEQYSKGMQVGEASPSQN